ncbi:MAG: hypothetical protein WD510_01410 [Balneolaceae bacterium]
MKRYLLAVIFLFFFSDIAFSQLYPARYRPPGLDWQQLKTGHFRILYPAAADSIALHAANILEKEYPKIQHLVGGSLSNFPVILNTYNDLSNGFVSPLNFRAEVEVPPIKGKAMNPRSGNWLDHVLPHELVHALHMNVNPSSLSSFAGWFSPDFRRSIHTAAPLGVFEGIAVEYESHWLAEGGGRGNYPYFENQFVSNFQSGQRWSMGQLIHVSTATLPYNRHYIGGYEFTNWLLESYGQDTVRRSIDFHYKWPFLGYGFALRQITGKWPSNLYRQFELNFERKLSPSPDEKEEALTTPHAEPIDISQKGRLLRRPLWLDGETLLLHGQFYNAATGFYTYDLSESNLQLLHESRSVEDYRFTVDPVERVLYFSDYDADTFYDNTFIADLFQLDLETEKRIRITENQRVYAPAPGSPFLALQTDGSGSSIVSVNRETREVSPFLTSGKDTSIIELQYHPQNRDLLAVIMKKGTVQGLWITTPDRIRRTLKEEPSVVFKNGSIFDLSWHPADYKLLFSSDHTGILNLYEYNLEKETVHQVTNSPSNAFEGSYSPDGDRIAYVLQKESEFIPVILNKNHFLNKSIPLESWNTEPSKPDTARLGIPATETAEKLSKGDQWIREPYKPGFRWLVPRFIVPDFERLDDDIYEIGLRLMSTEPLGRHSYDMTLTTVQDRVWFDMNYFNRGFYPGYTMNVFNQASFPFIQDNERYLENPVRFLLQERGASLGIPFRFVFERNTRLTSLSFTPKYKLSQNRFYRLDNPYDELNDYAVVHAGILSLVFNYRLRQFRRDLQPNAGWVITSQFDFDLNDQPFEFELEDYNFEGSFKNRKGLRAGVYKFLSPFGRWNQSLRLGTQVLIQSRFPKFGTQNRVSDAFSGSVFGGSNDLAFFDSRYTIPLAYPDQGGLLIPAYLSSIYLVLFSQTVGDLNKSSLNEVIDTSRTALGAGVRTRFRLSNFSIDLGIGVGYEPSRNNWNIVFGHF